MKNYHLHCYIALGLFTSSISSFATVIITTTIEQPVNLGAQSDPTRIPLGRVGTISNHGYGIHYNITESRPSPLGAMKWKDGSELDQNLASVFGISLETPDSTQIEAAPVTLRLSAWKPPAYSPYSKEQVLAATMWCLIRSVGGSEEHPLEIIVVAENPEDKLLEKKYSGNYARDKKDYTEPNTELKIGGSAIEVDARGVAWVVFPNVKRDAAFKPLPYGMIALENLGDGDSGWQLLPVWGNGEQPKHPLELNKYAVNICYSEWGTRGLCNANSYINYESSNFYRINELEKSTEVDVGYFYETPDKLAATVLALIIAAQPTAEKPLVVEIFIDDDDLEKWAVFRKANGWIETKHENPNSTHYSIKCEFVWDATAHKLTKGSLPMLNTKDSTQISPSE